MILVGLLGLFFTGVTAQTADNRKAVRKAERAQRQQERQALDRLYHNEAVQALDKRFFMMQTDRMMLRGGQVALVDPTEFCLAERRNGHRTGGLQCRVGRNERFGRHYRSGNGFGYHHADR